MLFISPQLASLVDEAPRGDHWIHEQKFDGYRIEAIRDESGLRLCTRRGNDWTTVFPSIVEAFEKLKASQFAIDGELAVVGADGVTNFQALQQALNTRAPGMVYFAFDLLALDGESLVALPLLQRKRLLAKLLARGPAALRYSDHIVGHGDEMFAQACKRGLEGIVSKRADAPYTPGRSKAWLKTKCRRRQELVVGGFTEPSGRRTGLGALLVGYYEGNVLRFAGKVGTGFSGRDLDELYRVLAPTERTTAPFSPMPTRAQTGPTAHWVEPKLVVEVAFGEWTEQGRLRHPAFQGIRRDKLAAEVTRE